MSVAELEGKRVIRPSLDPIDLNFELQRRSIADTKEELAKGGRLSLSRFIALSWGIVEPMREYVHGWHIDAICEHLEATLSGQITRLAIAVPPGMSKSLTTGVFYPAWLWGPETRSSKRIIGFSYDTALSTRDALRCRRLMSSLWYQRMWGDRFKLLDDENMKTRYANDQTGFRLSDYVGGGARAAEEPTIPPTEEEENTQ
jgi:hypothetical protein